ncbi:MAG: hypothetical protein JWP34_4771 [Massilia sp.]|jgi:hypothetical protein|nr:hypothetical protein [Massilia sp.]
MLKMRDDGRHAVKLEAEKEKKLAATGIQGDGVSFGGRRKISAHNLADPGTYSFAERAQQQKGVTWS